MNICSLGSESPEVCMCFHKLSLCCFHSKTRIMNMQPACGGRTAMWSVEILEKEGRPDEECAGGGEERG